MPQDVRTPKMPATIGIRVGIPADLREGEDSGELHGGKAEEARRRPITIYSATLAPAPCVWQPVSS